MSENADLNGYCDQTEVDVVEREATPQLLKLSIQLHLAGLSLSNTGSFLKVFGIDHAPQLSTTEFTRPIYSRRMNAIRITVRSTRR